MKTARLLRWSRHHAGLSQRELAAQTGIPQSTIGRIETGVVEPRYGTLGRLLRACGYELEVNPALGEGVDRSLICKLLSLTPTERVARLVQEERFVRAIERGGRQARKSAPGSS